MAAFNLISSNAIQDLKVVYLFISRQTYHILEVETINTFDETTHIAFDDIKLNADIRDAVFQFEIPIDADVITMDGQP